MLLVLVTGISGSGKSIAINVLEDDGFFCIDNLPAKFLPEVVMSLQEQGYDRVAVSIDARSGESLVDLKQIIAGASRFGHDVKVLFLNARTDILVQRYSETRRRHPLALRRGQPGEDGPTLLESIEHEREMMSSLEDIGLSIDTSELHPNVLRQWVREVVGMERAPVTLLFESFAFRDGIPLDADWVVDARMLPNPHYEPGLAGLTGRDAPVIEYLAGQEKVGAFFDDLRAFLGRWLPEVRRENRNYLTVAIGCTGGRHRSVYLAEKLARSFENECRVLVRHRGLAGAGP